MTELTEDDKERFIVFTENTRYYLKHEKMIMRRYGGKCMAIYNGGRDLLAEENMDALIASLRSRFNGSRPMGVYILQVPQEGEE